MQKKEIKVIVLKTLPINENENANGNPFKYAGSSLGYRRQAKGPNMAEEVPELPNAVAASDYMAKYDRGSPLDSPNVIIIN